MESSLPRTSWLTRDSQAVPRLLPPPSQHFLGFDAVIPDCVTSNRSRVVDRNHKEPNGILQSQTIAIAPARLESTARLGQLPVEADNLA